MIVNKKSIIRIKSNSIQYFQFVQTLKQNLLIYDFLFMYSYTFDICNLFFRFEKITLGGINKHNNE